ncbi:hypothetical protein [Sphingobacterium populi]|uniref:Uncharacterized protein n=1 Tax=Sphingobacterium populi TaxID=1812824 RepID=A0ABW5UE51_9SPHI
MAIQDEIYKLIEKEIDETLEKGKEKKGVDIRKAKEVSRMLASLSTDKNDSENLVNQYIANIKSICNA